MRMTPDPYRGFRFPAEIIGHALPPPARREGLARRRRRLVSPVRLERRVPEENRYRFYLLRLAPTLFGEWSLIREWGRIGQQGRMVLDTFATLDGAEAVLEDKKAEKQRLGYYLCS